MLRMCLVVFLSMTLAQDVFADDDDEKDVRKSNDCVRVGAATYFYAQTDRFVIVQNRSKNYLLSMKRSCPGLGRGHVYGFSGNRKNVCSNHRAKLIYYEQNIKMPECVVQSIEELENFNAAHALMVEREQEYQRERKEKKEARKKKKKEKEKKQ